MEASDSTTLAKMSNLASELQEIERHEGGAEDPSAIAAAREEVISAMEGVSKSLYEFAASLDRYRAFFKGKKRNWSEVLEKIAFAKGCSTRTLYRLLEKFDAAQQLPLYLVDAMLRTDLDPVAPGNHVLLKNLASAPIPTGPEEAETSLSVARSNVISMKSKKSVKSKEACKPTQVEEFATRIVRMFEARYRSYREPDRDEQIRFVLERVVNVLRADIHELRTYERPDYVPKPVRGVR